MLGENSNLKFELLVLAFRVFSSKKNYNNYIELLMDLSCELIFYRSDKRLVLS